MTLKATYVYLLCLSVSPIVCCFLYQTLIVCWFYSQTNCSLIEIHFILVLSDDRWRRRRRRCRRSLH